MKPGMKVLDMATEPARSRAARCGSSAPPGACTAAIPRRACSRGAEGVLRSAHPRRRRPLPFKSEHFDFVTMGIALRHVSASSRRSRSTCACSSPADAVDPRGPRPKSKLGHSLTRFVWAKLIPGMTLVSTGSRDAKLLMDYYWDTVEKCVPPRRSSRRCATRASQTLSSRW